MKRLLVLILVWTLLVVTGTIVSADGQTRRHKSQLLNLDKQYRITEVNNGIR
jgi:hypothetical protein